MQGLIIENISNLYKIQIGNSIYEGVARGKIKQEDICPVVGDIVDIEITDELNKKAVIEKVRKKKCIYKKT